MRTVGFSSVLIGFALTTGCLGTRGDDANPTTPQDAPGQYVAPGTQAYANPPGGQPGGMPAQPGAMPAQPGQPAPYAAPNAPAAPAPVAPFPGMASPQPTPAPAGPGAQPAPAAGPIPGLPAWPFPVPGGGTAPQQQPNRPGGGGAAQPQSTGGATPIDPNVASVATGPLMLYAAQEAPNMNREGTIIAGQFREGQTLEQHFQLLPNKCYTVLAVGVGIQETNISLIAVTPIPMASPVLAQDNTTGPSASLGGKGNCYKWQFPAGINAKYVVTAARGSGIAAAQLYSK